MAIQVTSKKVYSDKEPTPEERAAGVEYLEGGQLAEPELVDRRIEGKALRMMLEKDEGNISITVLPGDQLGQLSVNVQFEGKSGEHDICLQEQDALLQHAAEWLDEILSDFGCNFRAQIESLPCPHTAIRLQIDLAARRLAGERSRTIEDGVHVPERGREHKRRH
jgi:hypothetical protein